jgi:hypothetical protein
VPALNFNASGRYVDFGSASALDELANGKFTMWAWVWRLANGGNQNILAKDNAFPDGPLMLVDIDGSFNEGCVQLYVPRTVADTSYLTTSVITTAQPHFISATYDQADAVQATHVKIRTASLTDQRVAEPATYNTQTVGSGTSDIDAAANWYLGAVQRDTSLVFKGLIYTFGLSNTVLTQAELQAIADCRFDRLPFRPRGGLLWGRCGANGTGRVIDESGNGNHGTITGAVLSTASLPRRRRAV